MKILYEINEDIINLDLINNICKKMIRTMQKITLKGERESEQEKLSNICFRTWIISYKVFLLDVNEKNQSMYV